MNKINYILITLLLGGSVSLNAQTSKAASEMQLADTLSIGYQMNVSSRTSSYSINGVNASAFEKSPYIDISKALYGKVAGLNVYQGTGLCLQSYIKVFYSQFNYIITNYFGKYIQKFCPKYIAFPFYTSIIIQQNAYSIKSFYELFFIFLS